MAKKTIDHRQVILDKYMEYVLTHNEEPKSVFAFAKENGMKEAEFYTFFSSFESIESHIFSLFFENTLKLLASDESFEEGDAKHKLLSFYFTFFEILTANRSFVLQRLNSGETALKSLKKLSGLKEQYTQFVHGLDIEKLDLKMEKANQVMEKGIAEISYGQLLLVLKFWMNDTSPAFEKTDVFIEKSILAGFEVLNTKPLESLIDLGKFLWKERSFNTK